MAHDSEPFGVATEIVEVGLVGMVIPGGVTAATGTGVFTATRSTSEVVVAVSSPSFLEF
jgi:hypothetical protein